jgi:hypothetical protein
MLPRSLIRVLKSISNQSKPLHVAVGSTHTWVPLGWMERHGIQPRRLMILYMRNRLSSRLAVGHALRALRADLSRCAVQGGRPREDANGHWG